MMVWYSRMVLYTEDAVRFAVLSTVLLTVLLVLLVLLVVGLVGRRYIAVPR